MTGLFDDPSGVAPATLIKDAAARWRNPKDRRILEAIWLDYLPLRRRLACAVGLSILAAVVGQRPAPDAHPLARELHRRTAA